MFCGNCGNEVSINNGSCPCCGNRFDNRYKMPIGNSTKKSGKKKFILFGIIVASIITLITCFCIIFLGNGSNELTEEKVIDLMVKISMYEERDTLELDNYLEPQHLKVVEKSFTKEEMQMDWEDLKYEGLVSGEYSFNKYVRAMDEWSMRDEFDYYSDYENNDDMELVEIYKKYGSYEGFKNNKKQFFKDLEKYYKKKYQNCDIKISDCGDEILEELKEEMTKKIREKTNGKFVCDTSKWKEVKIVTIKLNDSYSKKTRFFVKIDNEWKLLNHHYLISYVSSTK